MVEIERRFLLLSPPQDLDLTNGTPIRQGYFTPPDGGPYHRVRQRGNSYTYTIKSGSGLVRSEIEHTITEDEFLHYWAKTEGMRLFKTRHHLTLSGFTAEIDFFHDELEGFRTVEVEFSSEEESQLFEPPEWFGPEVTTLNNYTNSFFAMHGIPKNHADLLKAVV